MFYSCTVYVSELEIDSSLQNTHARAVIYSKANDLIAEVLQVRTQTKSVGNPIIFLCHGVAGLIVKKALTICFQSSIPGQQDILWSTHALLFAATPHNGFSGAVLELARQHNWPSGTPIHLGLPLSDTTSLTEDFSIIQDRYQILCLCEKISTRIGESFVIIVESTSAAPINLPGARQAVAADHANIISLKSLEEDHSRMIISVLVGWIKTLPKNKSKTLEVAKRSIEPEAPSHSPETVGHLFKENTTTGGKVHFGNVYNYFGDINSQKRPSLDTTTIPISRTQRTLTDSPGGGSNKLYMVRRCSSTNFIGRKLQVDMISEFLTRDTVSHGDKPKIVILYGLGGSGKTQVCLRYAELHRHK